MNSSMGKGAGPLQAVRRLARAQGIAGPVVQSAGGAALAHGHAASRIPQPQCFRAGSAQVRVFIRGKCCSGSEVPCTLTPVPLTSSGAPFCKQVQRRCESCAHDSRRPAPLLSLTHQLQYRRAEHLTNDNRRVRNRSGCTSRVSNGRPCISPRPAGSSLLPLSSPLRLPRKGAQILLPPFSRRPAS